MNLQEQLTRYKKTLQAEAREEEIRETIRRSKEVFYNKEQEGILTYREFLWVQLKLIQKRWWFFQILLLSFLVIVQKGNQGYYSAQRSSGVIASLFIILIIPELWKNRKYQCMEIEASSYYSLRQIYAARMLLFGIVDAVAVGIFCSTASIALHFTLTELLIQFLFPMIITACICFGILCSRHSLSETAAVALCTLWGAIWWCITLNEGVYMGIALPLWLVFLGIALVFFVVSVYRTLNNYNMYWEGEWNGISSD